LTDLATLDTAFPLLAAHDQPAFAAIRADEIVPAVTAAIAAHQQAMAQCLARAGDPAMLAFKEEADRRIGEAWTVVGHLLAVANTPELRAAHAQAQPLIAGHFAAVGQDRALYEAIRAIDPGRSIRWASARANWRCAISSFPAWRSMGRTRRTLPRTRWSRAACPPNMPMP
jgi:oligopeptidase A